MSKQGNIRISSENMMPIIKKWLYSDKDIFLREIVANGVDAITKFRKLADMGEAQTSEEEYCIKVSIDKDAKTLSVEDNGIGMTEETRTKLFTLFFSSKGKGGTGIGLYVARQVVMQHGGRIEVASVKGEGSTFTVTMPRILAK